MTVEQIDKALEKILADKPLLKSLKLSKHNVDHLRHDATVRLKLEVLWKANKLEIRESNSTENKG